MIGRPESSTNMSASIENAILSIGSRRELFAQPSHREVVKLEGMMDEHI